MSKLKMWDAHVSWDQAEIAWDEGAKNAASKCPIKTLAILPNMPGMTEETKKHLKWKAFKWMIRKDHKFSLLKKFFKHPFTYGYRLIKSLLSAKSLRIDRDFYFYGINSEEEFTQYLKRKDTLLVLGFSYCHKPFECPSGRFSDLCIAEKDHPVCRQCFIGKCVSALPKTGVIPLFIPTIHYIGGKILDIVHANPEKKVIFLITACEMTLKMFADLGIMAGIKGIGVRLDGRICNTLKAFELSEEGIKPGLTVVTAEYQKKMLNLLRIRREA